MGRGRGSARRRAPEALAGSRTSPLTARADGAGCAGDLRGRRRGRAGARADRGPRDRPPPAPGVALHRTLALAAVAALGLGLALSTRGPITLRGRDAARGIPAAQRDRAPGAQGEPEAERRHGGEGERPVQRYPRRRRRAITRPAISTSPGSTTAPATKIARA